MRRRSTIASFAALAGPLFALLAAGCHQPPARRGEPTPDLGPAPDGTGRHHDADLATAPWVFFPEQDPTATAAVLLRATGLGDFLELEVLARGIDRLQGVAFRLRFDPARAQILKHEVAESWLASGQHLVTRFADRPEGEVWAGIAFLQGGMVLEGERVLARFRLKLSGEGPVTVAFPPGRNLALTPPPPGSSRASALALRWLGGTFRRLPAP